MEPDLSKELYQLLRCTFNFNRCNINTLFVEMYYIHVKFQNKCYKQKAGLIMGSIVKIDFQICLFVMRRSRSFFIGNSNTVRGLK